MVAEQGAAGGDPANGPGGVDGIDISISDGDDQDLGGGTPRNSTGPNTRRRTLRRGNSAPPGNGEGVEQDRSRSPVTAAAAAAATRPNPLPQFRVNGI